MKNYDPDTEEKVADMPHNLEKGDFKQARVYLVRLLQTAQEGEKTALEVELFATDLRLADVKTATATLKNVLSQRDLDEKEGLVQAIDQFLLDDSAEKTHRQTLEAIVKQLRVEQVRPNWDKLKAGWLPTEVKPASGGTTK